MITRHRLAATLVLGLAVSGCAGAGDLVFDQGVGITAVDRLTEVVDRISQNRY